MMMDVQIAKGGLLTWKDTRENKRYKEVFNMYGAVLCVYLSFWHCYTLYTI